LNWGPEKPCLWIPDGEDCVKTLKPFTEAVPEVGLSNDESIISVVVFARAVWPEQAEDLAFVHREVYPVYAVNSPYFFVSFVVLIISIVFSHLAGLKPGIMKILSYFVLFRNRTLTAANSV